MALPIPQPDLPALINSIPDLIWSVDDEYRLIFFNTAFQSFTHQWAPDTAIGAPFLSTVPPELGGRFQRFYARVFQGEEFTEQLILAQIQLELTFSPIRNAEQEVLGATVVARNITNRVQAEEALLRLNQTLQRRVEELSVLYRIAQVTVNITGMQAILERIVAEVTDIFGARGAMVALLNQAAGELVLMAVHDINPQAPSISNMVLPIASVPITRRLMDTPVPLVVMMNLHAGLLGPFAELAQQSGLLSMLLVPLRMRGIVIGGLVITSDRPGDTFLDLEIRLAETIAGQIASAVEHGRLLEEARKAQAAAEAASLAKSRFLAAMSHELRTPLNGLLGFTQIMLFDPNLQPGQREDLRLIQQSGEHLLTLINDILDLARIEAGITELAPEWVSLPDLLNGIANMIRVWAQQKGIGFEFIARHAPGLPLPDLIFIDSRRLRQILLNLLGNAVKFTASGQVALKAERLPNPAGGDPEEQLLRFLVSDTGIGIAPEDLVRVFDAFQQAGDSGQRAAGSGLGLPISQELAMLMGSRILVESTPGQGSAFWFDLRLNTREAPQAESIAFNQITHTAEADATANLAPELLEELRQLVLIGDIRTLRARAEQLIAVDAQARPFAEELLRLAHGFQLQRLRTLLHLPPAAAPPAN